MYTQCGPSLGTNFIFLNIISIINPIAREQYATNPSEIVRSFVSVPLPAAKLGYASWTHISRHYSAMDEMREPTYHD